MSDSSLYLIASELWLAHLVGRVAETVVPYGTVLGDTAMRWQFTPS